MGYAKCLIFFGDSPEQIKEDLPDVTTWSTGVLVFNPKAYDVFHESPAEVDEFLPISVYGETYYLFNTLYIIPDAAVDKNKAIEVIDTGVHFGQTNMAFDEKSLTSENILVFKSNTNKLLYSFCTDEFKNVYE